MKSAIGGFAVFVLICSIAFVSFWLFVIAILLFVIDQLLYEAATAYKEKGNSPDSQTKENKEK